MTVILTLLRLAIATLALAGTSSSWTLRQPTDLVYFTHQTNILLAAVMLWAVAASRTRLRQPPAWLRGMALLNIIITGLVSWLILPPSDPATRTYLLSIATVTMVHVATPLLAVVEFALGEHPVYRWRHVPAWLAYFPLYLGFVLVRAAMFPHSGPGEGGSPYPYGLIDVDQIGWGGLAVNTPLYLGAFALLAGLIVLADHTAGRLPGRVRSADTDGERLATLR